MENSDLTEADPPEVHDQGPTGGEERSQDTQVVAGSAGASSSPEAAPISAASNASHGAGANGDVNAVDSAAVVRFLLAAVEQITNANAGLPPPSVHVPQPPDVSGPTRAEGNTQDESPQPVDQPRQRDEVQLVEIRNPEGTGWSAMSKAVREYDEEEIGYYKDDIDTLLVFAGLYSAVLSAFIIESYTFLQPDTEDKMVFLFQNMLSQNYTMSNGFLNATNPYPALPEFEAPTWAIRVNVLWFSSLVVSVATASYGMLVKQWLREYLNTSKTTSPRERLRTRQYRRPALDRWMVFEIAASLPLLLEIALGLFFVGLCYFTTAIHSSISRSTIPFVAAWAFFFIVATIAPLVSPRCPFKTTILSAVLRQGRRATFVLAKACVPAYLAVRHSASSIVGSCRLVYKALRHASSSTRSYILHSSISDAVRFCHIVVRARADSLRASCSLASAHLTAYIRRHTHPSILYLLTKINLPHFSIFATEEQITSVLVDLGAHMEEEAMILETKQDDIVILKSVEEIIPGDGLLSTVVDVASAADPPWNEAFAFMKTIIDSRTGRPMDINDPSTWIESLRLISQQSCDALTSWVSTILSRHQADGTLDSEELRECASLYCSLLFSHDRPIPELRQRALYDLILHCRITFPAQIFHLVAFTGRLQEVFTESGLKKWRLGITSAECASAVEHLILQCNNFVDMDGDLYGDGHRWIVNALCLLVTQWTRPSSRNLPTKNRASSPFTNRLVEKLLDELCRIERRGRIYGMGAVRIDVFYGILLSGATSKWGEWQYSSKLFARNLTSICQLEDDEPYRRGEDEGPTSPKTAFLSLMKSHSETWMATLLGWLAPSRMPGNILAEIVAADLAACGPDGQRRRLDDLIHICQIVSLEISPPDSYSAGDGIDCSTLLQIVILLQRGGILDDEVSEEKVHAIRTALGAAVIRRHTAYRALINFRLRNDEFRRADGLIDKMRAERLDLVYAMGYGCYRESGWAGAINQRIRESEHGIFCLRESLHVGRLHLLVGEAWMEKRTEQIRNKDGGRRASQPSKALDSDESNSLDH